MTSHIMKYGSDSVRVELGQPSDPILVEGQNIGRQCADGSCKTDQCLQIAARHCWGPVFPTLEAAIAAGYSADSHVCIWDDVEVTYEEGDLERIAREDSEREDACTACQLLGCSRGSMCGLRQTEKSGRCECGEATGVRCDGVGAVTVEWMPVWLRAEHVEARNRGVYPHNGALRLFVTQTCAEMLAADGAEVVP